MFRKLSIFALGAIVLAACSTINPLGYCADDGWFYFEANGNVQHRTPNWIIKQGYDPYAYGDWCPVGTLPTVTNTAVPPTATAVPSFTPTATATDWPTDSPTATPVDTLVPAPTSTMAPTDKPLAVVIENMYLIKGVVFGQDELPSRWKRINWCILISDTHPSWEQQVAKCFPPFGWWPLNAECAGPVWENDTWKCDRQMKSHDVTRMSLEALCEKYGKWCN